MIGFGRGIMLELHGIQHRTEASFLQVVGFDLHFGRIMGIIGDDKSGKNLLLSLILGYAFPQRGVIRFMNAPLRYGDERIVPVLPRSVYPPQLTLLKLEKLLRSLVSTFRSERYFELLSRFVLPPNKKVGELDGGMQIKLQLAAALSTEAKLLVMFEVLDHMDYIAEEELKELLLEFISEGDRSVLLSTDRLEHVESIIDDITFLHNGRQLFSEACDELPREFAVLRCSPDEMAQIDQMKLIGLTQTGGECEALVHRVDFEGSRFTLEAPTPEDAIRFSLAQERREENA